MSKLKVVDFFCGAGGFSEGFRQAGFDVILAVDNWKIAVDTHNENHPEGLAIQDDVIRISNLSDNEFHEIVPDSEVIIGSPPCTDFSNSNKSGNGDKSKGIQLVEAYLKIVARKKHKKNSILKYWILENVPKIRGYVKTSYKAKELGLKGSWSLTVKGDSADVYNAKYFGVPSNRKRYFCGEFPVPQEVYQDDSELIHLRTVLSALGKPKEKLHKDITDPIYGISLPGECVTDHHYVQYLSDFEKIKATRLKTDKGYMGKMSIPENLEKPARTIMATMSFTSRECFVLGQNYSNLRAPTIREVASLMSFPIDYRFYGNSLGTKYRMVGNAVPPKMSYALAKGILKKEKMNGSLNGYKTIEHAHQLGFVDLNLNEIPIKIEKQKKATARFKYHIPYFKFDTYRVELTNYHSHFKKEEFKWTVEIHFNQGKEKAKVYTPQIANIHLNNKNIEKADKFFTTGLIKKIVGFNEFQRIHCMTSEEVNKNKLLDPYGLLKEVREFLDQEFNFQNNWDYVKIEEAPAILPEPIVVGYFILSNFVDKMQYHHE